MLLVQSTTWGKRVGLTGSEGTLTERREDKGPGEIRWS